MTTDIRRDIQERIARLSPEQRAVLEQRLVQQRLAPASSSVIPRRATAEPCALSFAQQRLWFLAQFAPQNPLYNESQAVRLQGSLEVEALSQALTAVVERHEVLRTTFTTTADGLPLQVVRAPRACAVPIIDLRSSPEVQRVEATQRYLAEVIRQPFDLTTDLMLRACLLRLDEAEYILLLVMHHIASDGWSSGILLRELSAAYQACRSGQALDLPVLPIQYADYALWQRQRLQGDVLNEQLTYWQQKLAGAPDRLELPTDYPWPALQTYRGARYAFALPPELTTAVRAVGQQASATLFMTLLAAFYTLLYRYTGQEDIVVGSPIAGRLRAETEGLIGFFVNTLLLRGDLTGAPTFRALLERVRQVALEAFAHQELPFEKLVEVLQPERHLSHNPLCQVIFALQNVRRTPLTLPEATVTPVEVHNGAAKFPLIVFMREEDGTLRGSVEYNMGLFEEATISRLCGHFVELLQSIVAHPEQSISTLPLLSAAERQQVLVEWNATRTAYPRAATIPQLFAAQVAHTPEAVALIAPGQELTYRDLNARANRLAHLLLQYGVRPEEPVGCCLERSVEAIVALLAISKAGGAYVPLDPAYPRERLAFMLSDTAVHVLITQTSLRAQLPPHQATVLCLDTLTDVLATLSSANPASCITGESLAYIMYTSGSTGQPKGVSVPHRGVVRLVRATNYVTLNPEETLLHLAPLSFDASTFEIWGSLLNGARLVLFPPHTPLLEELGAFIAQHGITTLWLPAGLFRLMVDSQLSRLRGVRQLLTGGDVVAVPQAQRLLREVPECTLINGYGPTENTTFTCCAPLTSATSIGLSVPLGRPIANTRVYVLDRQQQPVPVGVPGELYAAGDGLARGYFRRPGLTAERFVTVPAALPEPGEQLYRTGDLVRWRPDGLLEFLGRLDEQVKIRGFRVEPGEIETVLSEHPALGAAVVTAQPDSSGEKRLVAYYVPRAGTAPDSAALRGFLLARLPEYMVPSLFVPLPTLPLTPNGKINRQALPAPEQGRGPLPAAFTGPRTPLEQQLSVLWATLLGVPTVGINDNFFALGGHSLLAVRLLTEIERALHCDMPLATLFQYPTIAQLSEYLSQSGTQSGRSFLLPYRPAGTRPAFFCVHGVEGVGQYLPPEQPFYAFQPHVLDGYRPPDSVAAMAADYLRELRLVQPAGPYYLGGMSIGGLVAFEMAHQLQQQGQEIALLALIDPTEPGARVSPASFVRQLKHWWNQGAIRAGQWSLAYWKHIPRPLRYRYFIGWSLHVARQYTPPPSPHRLVILQAEQRPVPLNPWWECDATGDIVVDSIPGDHFSMFREPHVRILAARLNACLEAAQEDGRVKAVTTRS